MSIKPISSEKAINSLSPPRRALWKRILLPRFSLRTMLICITLFAIVLSWTLSWVRNSTRQHKIVAKVWKLNLSSYLAYDGAHVEYDFEYDPSRSSLNQTPRSNVPGFFLNLLGPDYFHNVVRVDLGTKHQTDEYLQVLEQLPKLNTLRSLTLSLDQEKFTTETFAMLDQMPFLEQIELDLFYRTFSENDAAMLKKYPQLKKLHFYRCSGIELDLRRLAELDSVEELSIEIQQIVPKTIEVGSPMNRVKKLTLISPAGKYFNQEYIDAISKMFPEIEVLEIGLIDDHNVLRPLKNLKSLKNLILRNVNGLENKIKTMFPNVKIEFWTGY